MLKRLIASIQYLRRISVALEKLALLYEADLYSRGIIITDTSINDPVEVQYGVSPLSKDQ